MELRIQLTELVFGLMLTAALAIIPADFLGLQPLLDYENLTDKVVNSTLRLKKGDGLDISCYGQIPVEWIVKQGMEVSGPDFANGLLPGILTTEEEVSDVMHVSHLVIKNIQYIYTGLYTCRLKGTPEQNVSVYIYAEDPEQPFVDHNYIVKDYYTNPLFLTEGQKGVFPCRTSSPDYQVMFMTFAMPPKIYGPEDGVTFDPKEGIIVDPADQFEGEFACEVSIITDKGMQTYFRTWQTQVLENKDLNQPNGNGDAVGNGPKLEFQNLASKFLNGSLQLKKGDTLNISCVGTGEIQWIVLQGAEQHGPKFDFSRLAKVTIIEEQRDEEFISILTVRNIQYGYTGRYMCRYVYEAHKKSTIYVYVKDPDNPFVDPGYSSGSPYQIELKLGQTGMIPCRTGSPDYKVIFSCVCNPPKVYGSEDGINFDPEKGVEIRRVEARFEGNYKCSVAVPTASGVKTVSRIFHARVPVRDVPELQPVLQFYHVPDKLKNNTLILKTGEKLDILCFGQRQVEWIVRQGTDIAGPDFQQSILQHITVVQEEVNPKLYVSHLVVKDIRYDYTGLYTCRLKDMQKQNVSVYVYAEDPHNPFVDHHYFDIEAYVNSIILYHGTRGVFPCRTSSPDYNVVFTSYNYPPRIYGLDDGVTFDPKEGVIIDIVDRHDGVFACEINITTDEGTEMFVRKWQTHIFIQQEEAPQPKITPNEEIYRLVGENFNLSCEVNYVNYMRVGLRWSYIRSGSSQEIELKSQPMPSARVSITKPFEVETKDSMRITRSGLEIRGVNLKDTGEYKCTANAGKKFGTDIVILHVIEPEKSYVYLRTEKKVVTVQEGANETVFDIEVFAYPKPKFYWMKGNRNLTARDTNIAAVQQGDIVLLWLRFPRREHAGNYTMVAWNAYMRSSVSVQLIVEYSPLINISNTNQDEFFLMYIEHHLDCNVRAIPFPTSITWYFQKCDVPTNCSQPAVNKWVQVKQKRSAAVSFPKITNLLAKDGQTNTSRLSLLMKEKKIGWFKCEAKNLLGSATSVKQYVSTVIRNGFEFTVSKSDPIVGDSVNLSAKASVLKYSNLTVINGTNSSYLYTNLNNDRTTVTYKEDIKDGYVYSVQFDIMISPVTEFDRNTFSCAAFDHNKTLILPMKRLRLKVRDIVPPYFETEASQSNINANTKAFDCDIHGVPKPVIEWYKNFRLLNPVNMSEAIEITKDGKRLKLNSTNNREDGVYTCLASNRGGYISKNFTHAFESRKPPVGLGTVEKNVIISCSVLILALIVIAVIICWIVRKKSAELHKELEQYLIQPKGDYNPDLPIDEQTACLPYDAKWEFPKERLRLGMILGQGAFGRVVKAEAIGIVEHVDVLTVAVKMVKDCTDREQMMTLLSELKILIHIGQHLNILNLLGAVAKNIARGELYVIVEYCHFGNLRNYILKNKDQFVDTMDDGYLDPVTQKMKEAADEAAVCGDGEKPSTSKPYYINKAAPENTADLVGPPLTKKNMISWAFLRG